MPDMWDVQLLAAGLRADRADVASQARVLTGALAGALPPGMVEVVTRRSLGDRMAGREGTPVSVVVHGHERDLELRDGPRGVEAELRQVVRGIVISRRPIALDEWLRALAEDLQRIAAQDAAAREALERLLSP
jgi:hypothetical protein